MADPWKSPFLPGHRKAPTSDSQLFEAPGFLLRNALRGDCSCRGHLRTLQGGQGSSRTLASLTRQHRQPLGFVMSEKHNLLLKALFLTQVVFPIDSTFREVSRDAGCLEQCPQSFARGDAELPCRPGSQVHGIPRQGGWRCFSDDRSSPGGWWRGLRVAHRQDRQSLDSDREKCSSCSILFQSS